MPESILVRYGAMGEVGRFVAANGRTESETAVATAVVVRTARGEELGTVIGSAGTVDSVDDASPCVLRVATDEDQTTLARHRADCEREFPAWQNRIRDWQVDLELIDLERTLDGQRLILYVLNDRGPETTKLALRAAAAGFGVIEVQPVGPEGLIPTASGGGGCGNCGRK